MALAQGRKRTVCGRRRAAKAAGEHRTERERVVHGVGVAHAQAEVVLGKQAPRVRRIEGQATQVVQSGEDDRRVVTLGHHQASAQASVSWPTGQHGVDAPDDVGPAHGFAQRNATQRQRRVAGSRFAGCALRARATRCAEREGLDAARRRRQAQRDLHVVNQAVAQGRVDGQGPPFLPHEREKALLAVRIRNAEVHRHGATLEQRALIAQGHFLGRRSRGSLADRGRRRARFRPGFGRRLSAARQDLWCGPASAQRGQLTGKHLRRVQLDQRRPGCGADLSRIQPLQQSGTRKAPAVAHAPRRDALRLRQFAHHFGPDAQQRRSFIEIEHL